MKSTDILRLRGGGTDDDTDTDMDMNTEIQDTRLAAKRFKSSSPEAISEMTSDNITSALNKVNVTIGNIRSYMAEMTSSTKIGKKWAGGLEEFLTEILVNTKRIAIEAAEVIGAINCPWNSKGPTDTYTNCTNHLAKRRAGL